MPASTFIVTFKPDTPEDVINAHIERARQSGCNIKHRYDTAIKGYAVEVPDEAVSAMSFSDDAIDYVEPDGEVSASGMSLLA